MENKKLNFAVKDCFCFRHYETKVEEMATEYHNVFHCHPQYEIYYFVRGQAKFTVNEKIFLMNNGDVLVIQGNNHHTIEVNQDYDYERYVIEIKEEFLPTLNGITPLKQDFNHTIHALHLTKDEVEKSKIFEKLRNVEETCLDESIHFKSHVVLSKIIEIASEISWIYENNHSLEFISSTKNKNEANINRAFEYINQNLNKMITINELCKYSYLSRSYFQHVFKRYTGLSVTDYIMRQKMNTARYMLNNGYSLQEVSDALGYKYYSLFSVHFKKFFGFPPKNH